MSLDDNFPWGQNQTIENIKFDNLPEELLEGGYEIILIAGPNAVGKGSIIDGLLSMDIGYSLVNRTTSKQIAPTEINYHSVDSASFINLANQNAFLEWSKFGQGYYGTSISDIFEALKSGRKLIIDVDVDGALLLRSIFEHIGIKVTDCFISPVPIEDLSEEAGIQKALDILRERLGLRSRGEFLLEIEGRIKNARKILQKASVFRTYISNIEGELSKSILTLRRLIDGPEEP